MNILKDTLLTAQTVLLDLLDTGHDVTRALALISLALANMEASVEADKAAEVVSVRSVCDAIFDCANDANTAEFNKLHKVAWELSYGVYCRDSSAKRLMPCQEQGA